MDKFVAWLAPIAATLVTLAGQLWLNGKFKSAEDKRDAARAETDAKRAAEAKWRDEMDVTGDGELDLVRYDGGRASTSLSIGKIEGWHLLDRELENVATITRDADGGYIITPIEA